MITHGVDLTYTILSSLGPVICTSRSFAPGFTAKQKLERSVSGTIT